MKRTRGARPTLAHLILFDRDGVRATLTTWATGEDQIELSAQTPEGDGAYVHVGGATRTGFAVNTGSVPMTMLPAIADALRAIAQVRVGASRTTYPVTRADGRVVNVTIPTDE